MTGQVVPASEARRHERYKRLEARMRADHGVIMEKTASFWSAAWEIYRDDLWNAAHPSREAWIESLATEIHGPAPAQFYSVMRLITASLDQGMELAAVLFIIATNKTAILYDVPKFWFKRVGRGAYELRPEIAAALESEGLSYTDKVLEVAAQSARDARKSVSEAKGGRHVTCIEREWAVGLMLVRLAESGGNGPTLFHDVQIAVAGERTPILDSYLEGKFNPVGD